MNSYFSLFCPSRFSRFFRATFLLSLLFTLPTAAAPEAEAAANSRSAFLEGSTEDKILPPDQAFKLSVNAKDAQTLEARFEIAPGHYLYRERIKFDIKAPAGSSIATIDLPKGELKQDPTFGATEVYHQSPTAVIRLARVAQGPITLSATYQGCSEKGLCYAPIHKKLNINLPDANNSADSTSSTLTPVAGAASDDQAASLLKSGKLWLIATGFFGFGLLLSLTPCVLPMIPILSGIIVGGKQGTRLHTFNLSLAYTMGMALSYTLAGIAAGLSGHLISTALQNPWVLGFGALIFVLLALSMFGFYELQLPTALESRMANLTNRIKGGRFVSVFIMGVLSALIISPCVAAPLAGALLYIGQTHDVVLGGTALFALSMGMGVPLLLIGASAGTLLPKTGPWMNAVNNLFGVIMLAMAVWLISPVLPAGLVMALWAALLIVPAIYMHALDSLPPKASHWAKLWKGIAIILLITGIAILLGALSGSRSLLQPLAGLRTSVSSDYVAGLPFQRVKNLAELEGRIKTAAGKTVMLDFYADWCITCKEYEHYTFSDPRVQKALQNVVLLQADVTQNSAENAAILKRFDLFGPPAIIFFDGAGQEMTQAKVTGYQDADKFLATLNKLNTIN